MRRLGVREKSDERILGKGEFIEQLIQQSDKRRKVLVNVTEYGDQPNFRRLANNVMVIVLSWQKPLSKLLALAEPVTKLLTGSVSAKQRDGESWKNNTNPCFPRKPSGFIHLPETTVGCYVDHPISHGQQHLLCQSLLCI